MCDNDNLPNYFNGYSSMDNFKNAESVIDHNLRALIYSCMIKHVSNDINISLKKEQLKMKLDLWRGFIKSAIDREDYEEAAKLRDEIKEIENGNS